MKRHIGRLVNTDQRCVVVYMQIPGREDHALIASTDSMHPRFEQAVMEILESPEGQSDPVLANVLARRLMPESGKSVLQAMHEMGILTPVHVDRVVMLPQPGMPFPLRQIIEGMGNTLPKIDDTIEPQPKYNPHTVNTQALSDENRVAIARNLLVEADLLDGDAKRKREQAYAYAPELRPADPVAAAPVAAPVTEEPVAVVEAVKEAKPRRGRRKATAG